MATSEQAILALAGLHSSGRDMLIRRVHDPSHPGLRTAKEIHAPIRFHEESRDLLARYLCPRACT